MKKTTLLKNKIHKLYDAPFLSLIEKAYRCHIKHFDPCDIEYCVLSSIKTGGCPEDCAYCPQSAHHKTSLKRQPMLQLDELIAQAKQAKANGAVRFCMGAAFRSPPKRDFPKVLEMIRAVKNIGIETCVTLGMLNEDEVAMLEAVGLDYYNHNIDTSPDYYSSIISTRTFRDRIDTIHNLQSSSINLCCGGILGMGESRDDRVLFLMTLKSLPTPPKSIPINQLIPIEGTPLANASVIEPFEFIRTIAIARILFPTSRIRLSAGREHMSDEMQAFCFMAGANSIFIGDTLLTAKNPGLHRDMNLLKRLNMNVPKEMYER